MYDVCMYFVDPLSLEGFNYYYSVLVVVCMCGSKLLLHAPNYCVRVHVCL